MSFGSSEWVCVECICVMPKWNWQSVIWIENYEVSLHYSIKYYAMCRPSDITAIDSKQDRELTGKEYKASKVALLCLLYFNEYTHINTERETCAFCSKLKAKLRNSIGLFPYCMVTTMGIFRLNLRILPVYVCMLTINTFGEKKLNENILGSCKFRSNHFECYRI